MAGKKKTGSSKKTSTKGGGGDEAADQAVTFGSKGQQGEIRTVALDAIKVPKGHNPRSQVEGLSELKSSIRKQGLLNPIVVRPADKAGKTFNLVAGERRFRALEALKHKTVPVNVRRDIETEEQALAFAIAENNDETRYPLGAFETAKSLKKLKDKGWSQQDISNSTGVHYKSVSRYLQLMDAPKDVRDAVESGTLSLRAAIEAANISTDDIRKRTLAECKNIGDENPSANTIKTIAKRLSKDAGEEGKPDSNGDGTSSASTGSGSSSSSGSGKRRATSTEESYSWQSKSEKHQWIEMLGSILRNADESEKQESDYLIAAGAFAYALWDRGEIDFPFPPGEDPDEGETKAQHKKRLSQWQEKIEREGKAYDERQAEDDESSDEEEESSDDEGKEEAEEPSDDELKNEEAENGEDEEEEYFEDDEEEYFEDDEEEPQGEGD